LHECEEGRRLPHLSIPITRVTIAFLPKTRSFPTPVVGAAAKALLDRLG
jgi:hypothetical protein